MKKGLTYFSLISLMIFVLGFATASAEFSMSECMQGCTSALGDCKDDCKEVWADDPARMVGCFTLCNDEHASCVFRDCLPQQMEMSECMQGCKTALGDCRDSCKEVWADDPARRVGCFTLCNDAHAVCVFRGCLLLQQ